MVGIMSICTGFGHYWGRNGEFCVAVGPTTKTTGILYASLIGFNPSLKGQRGWAPSRRISQSMWKSSACMVAILQQKRVRAKIVTLRVLVQHLGHYNTLRHSDILKGRKLGIPPPLFPTRLLGTSAGKAWLLVSMRIWCNSHTYIPPRQQYMPHHEDTVFARHGKKWPNLFRMLFGNTESWRTR